MASVRGPIVLAKCHPWLCVQSLWAYRIVRSGRRAIRNIDGGDAYGSWRNLFACGRNRYGSPPCGSTELIHKNGITDWPVIRFVTSADFLKLRAASSGALIGAYGVGTSGVTVTRRQSINQMTHQPHWQSTFTQTPTVGLSYSAHFFLDSVQNLCLNYRLLWKNLRRFHLWSGVQQKH